MFVPVEDSTTSRNLADLAATYRIPGEVVDGQDVVAVYKATQKAVLRARNGEGSSILEFKTYRMRPHSEGDKDLRQNKLRSQNEIKEWAEKDPITLFQHKLLEQSILTQIDVEEINQEADEEIAEAAKFAEESPLFDPSLVEFDKLLYA